MLLAAIECPTHSIIDAALRSLPVVLPALDFSTIKNELFPVIAAVFTRTNSLAIKVRGLQAFVILCGGSADAAADDGLNGLAEKSKTTSSSSALDKYTMQEKIVPLVRGIKTKEPAVMMAALNVLRIVGQVADSDFVAMDVLPILWSMSLGPLLELKQFRTFMDLIKTLSARVEEEQGKKLQELTGSNGSAGAAGEDFMAFGGVTGTAFDAGGGGGAAEDDFESLVKGKGSIGGAGASNGGFGSWDDTPGPSRSPSTAALGTAASISRTSTSTPQTPSFSWSTPPPPQPQQTNAVKAQASFRTVTPDLARFETLTPSSTQFSQPLRPTPQQQQQQQVQPAAVPSTSINWSSAATSPPVATSSNAWASSTTPSYSSSAFGGMSNTPTTSSIPTRPPLGTSNSSSFSLPPPPGGTNSGFSIAPPPSFAQPQQQQQPRPQVNWGQPSPSGGMASSNSMSSMTGGSMQQQQQPPPAQPQQRSGLDKYESLI